MAFGLNFGLFGSSFGLTQGTLVTFYYVFESLLVSEFSYWTNDDSGLDS